MRLSAKTEYASIAVLELARQWTSGEPGTGADSLHL